MKEIDERDLIEHLVKFMFNPFYNIALIFTNSRLWKLTWKYMFQKEHLEGENGK